MVSCELGSVEGKRSILQETNKAHNRNTCAERQRRGPPVPCRS